jgi:di-heme oxidoreductase (putative peroxidase)
MRDQRALPTSLAVLLFAAVSGAAEIGREVAVPRHLQDGEESRIGVLQLIAHGQQVFAANWTAQEGAGRPLAKGTGPKISDLEHPLVFPRNFNRISGPDANSCAGCHNAPFGIAGGGGDIVANVFVLAQRFDFANFDGNEPFPTVASHDERGAMTDLDTIANSRATLGMFGSGYIEMLARQMTAELEAQRDTIAPGGERALAAKGVSFGVLRRLPSGAWDTSGVVGLPPPSLNSTGADHRPTLVIRPFHQAGAVISLRQFSNNAFNHHHGIQSSERFGRGVDFDGDGFRDELTVADVTAVSVFQATMAVPGRVIPRDPEIEQAVLAGERTFARIGCNGCHVERLPLDNWGWIYTEPNPYNPNGNLQPGDVPEVRVNLNGRHLPPPRLRATDGITWVPAYTDLKLHDITSGPDDPNREPLDMQFALGSSGFFAGNARFLTRKLWGAANEPPYFHHGKFTTLREAILAHAGEAAEVSARFRGLAGSEQDEVVEFLKTLQVLPPGTRSLVVDERFQPRSWPPK